MMIINMHNDQLSFYLILRDLVIVYISQKAMIKNISISIIMTNL